jgi:hypothetical protein
MIGRFLICLVMGEMLAVKRDRTIRIGGILDFVMGASNGGCRRDLEG